jgi:hypothetical protein
LNNVEQLVLQLGAARLQVPSDKKIVLIPMAYDRNGAWGDIVKLRDVQTASYLVALQDARVIGIDPFSYARPGGTRCHSDLMTPHRLMSEGILRVPYPGAGNGPRSLLVKAVTTDGRVGHTRIGVWVRNRLFFDMPADHGARTAVEKRLEGGHLRAVRSRSAEPFDVLPRPPDRAAPRRALAGQGEGRSPLPPAARARPVHGCLGRGRAVG